MERHSVQLAHLLQLYSDIREEDALLLQRIANALDILADISHADITLYVKSNSHCMVLAQAQPTSVPPIHLESLVGRSFARDAVPLVHRALFNSRFVHGVRGQLIHGTPTIVETYPIRNSRGSQIAVLCIEMNLLEYERRRKKNPILRHAISCLRSQVILGQLEVPEYFGRIGENYATMVIDGSTRILYISTLAEQLYRKLGYTTSLLGRRLFELDTNEHVCFKALERGHCLQQRVDEHNLVWIKWVIPLPAEHPRTVLGRLFQRNQGSAKAIVLIQDITEEYRKEQALRVKSALIREIHHRVKNNLQTIASLLRMQARRTGSPEVLDMLKQSINRILSIALVHEFLSHGDSLHEESNSISIRDVIQRLVSEVTQGILDPEKNIRISLDGIDIYLPPQQATSCALIVNELLQNSVEHGFESKNEGNIRVNLREGNNLLVIEVVDNGQGLPPNFDVDRDGSLGLQIVQTLVREDLKGNFSLKDCGGVIAQVSFPRNPTVETQSLLG
ncbi:MAG: sensor histidine kinase [Chloroflexota bacterium]|jgi:two-component sensor histidine kinase